MDDLDEYWDAYYEWLIDQLDTHIDNQLSYLLICLNNTPFEPSLQEDKDISERAAYMRLEFLDTYSEDIDSEILDELESLMLNKETSMLEIILFMSRELDEIAEDATGYSIPLWFTTLLDNIGILQYTNEDWKQRTGTLISKRCYDVSQRIGDRRFFYWKREKWRGKNWDSLGLWLQLNQWAMKNYDLGFHA